MKKLILLSLTVIGIGMAGTSAQAGGVTVFVSPFRVPFFVPPVPILAPAVVFSTGGYGPAVAGGYCAPGYQGVRYVPGYYHGYPYGWYRGGDRFHDGWGHGNRDGHHQDRR
jgi:hypothetical protein